MDLLDRRVLARAGLDRLIAVLLDRGYRVVGPVPGEGAIVYGDVRSTADLPVGWTEVQDAGTYRLARRADEALFGYVVGPHSLKQFLFPPRQRLFQARRDGAGFTVDAEPVEAQPLAVIGARGCDLAGVAVQDRVFQGGPFASPDYAARRAGLFVVAVNCGQAGGTCFCVSMGTGPRVSQARHAFDLALTELLDGAHRFLVEVGSPAGAAVLAEACAGAAAPEAPPAWTRATLADEQAADAAVDHAARQMGRTMDTEGLPELLAATLTHPQWDDVAQRCLGCTNCTLVCPTCFCSSVEDLTDLRGETAERWRRWDSCFTLDHSFVGGAPARVSLSARYRQWLTHKLGTWVEQFGSSGCVGCGRCITWCPVGIDLTAEVAALRSNGSGQAAGAANSTIAPDPMPPS